MQIRTFYQSDILSGLPLIPGSISATPGDSTVQISQLSAPSGGSGSYTRDLYRSTTNGLKGSLLQASVSLPYNDDTAVNDTTYWYTLEVDDGVSTEDTAQVSATPAASGAWFIQDWDYADIDAVLADSNNSDNTWQASDGQVELLTGLTGVPDGSTKAIRAQYLSSGSRSDQQVGLNVGFPDASIDQPREVWIEFYARFSSNWTTLGPESGEGDHKFIFLWDDQITSGYRYGIYAGTFGTDIQSTVDDGVKVFNTTGQIDVSTLLWNGNWVLVRIHAKMASSGGLMDSRVGSEYIGGATGNTSPGASSYFDFIVLGANVNKGCSEDQSFDISTIKVYTSDPGWGANLGG